jgi:hypothetical protein
MIIYQFIHLQINSTGEESILNPEMQIIYLLDALESINIIEPENLWKIKDSINPNLKCKNIHYIWQKMVEIIAKFD